MNKNKLIAKFYAEINKLGLQELKDEIVYVQSDGRTTHVSELSLLELYELLKVKFPNRPKPVPKQKKDNSDKLRKRILSICHQLHWNKINPATGRHDIDWQRLSTYLQKHFGHPNLNHYSHLILRNKIIPAFNAMLTNYLKKS